MVLDAALALLDKKGEEMKESGFRRVWKGAFFVLAALLCCVAAFTPLCAQAETRLGSGDVIIDDVDPRCSYSAGSANNGGWDGGGSGDHIATEHWSNTVGATVDISFEGEGFELYGIKASNHRYMSISVDGADPIEFDCYAPSRQSNQKLVAVEGLKQGAHVARVTVLEKTNPAASNALGGSLQYAIAKNVPLDPDRDITTRIEVGAQTDADELFRWHFAGNWTYGNGHPELFSAGDEIYSGDPDAAATIRFEGTRIIVGGSLNTAHSVYRFTLDGKDAGTFDAGDTGAVKHQQTLFDSGVLDNGGHTLVITNVGSKSIQLDYADVIHKPIKPTGIKLGTGDFVLESGQEKKVEASFLPSIADPVALTWESSDEAVATVSDKGLVAAKGVDKKSTAIITARIDGTDVSASVEVTVYPAVKLFNAFVGDEKILDLPATAYEDATHTFTDSWSSTAWRGDARASKIGVATRDEAVKDVVVEVSDFTDGNGGVIKASNVDVRWLREVEADSGRGMSGEMASYPDVIYYPNTGLDIPAKSLRFAWVTLTVPEAAKPGTYTGTLTVRAGDVSYELGYTLEVLDLVQPTAEEVGYHVQLWQHPFSATGYYFGKSTVDATSSGSGLWGAPIGTDAPISKFMDADFRAYYRGMLEDYAAMGGDDLVANIVDDAWGHQCYYSDSAMVTWKKTADGWVFDYTLFDAWVEFAIECGVIDPANGRGAIKCYSMIPWNNQIAYIDETDGGKEKTVSANPGSEVWQSMWTPFLEDFMAHLDERGWLDITYIAFDERPGVDTVCEFIKAHKHEGKTLKTAAAINYSPANIGKHQFIDDVSVGQKHVLSAWSMDEWYRFVDERREAGLQTTMYTCTGDYPNSSQQADPGDIYWSALYSQALHTDGYLRWALDAWINDMYGDTSYINWEPGDAWFVYPLELGADGTYDPARLAEHPEGFYSSPRYEMFKQGVRDVCKARYLVQLGGETADSVTALFDSMRFPSGSNNVPSNQEQRMLAHSESARMYAGLNELARNVVPEPEPETFTVTFDDRIPGHEDLVVTVKAGEVVAAPPMPELAGWKFTGWYSDGHEGGWKNAWDFDTPIDADLTLTAQWVEDGDQPVVDPDDPSAPGDGSTSGSDQDGSVDKGTAGDIPQTGDPAMLAVIGTAAAAAVALGAGVVSKKRGRNC